MLPSGSLIDEGVHGLHLGRRVAGPRQQAAVDARLVGRTISRVQPACGRVRVIAGEFGSFWERPHTVVAGAVLEFGESERLEQGRYVHAEAAAQALLQPVPAADRIVRRAAPRLDTFPAGTTPPPPDALEATPASAYTRSILASQACTAASAPSRCVRSSVRSRSVTAKPSLAAKVSRMSASEMRRGPHEPGTSSEKQTIT